MSDQTPQDPQEPTEEQAPPQPAAEGTPPEPAAPEPTAPEPDAAPTPEAEAEADAPAPAPEEAAAPPPEPEAEADARARAPEEPAAAQAVPRAADAEDVEEDLEDETPAAPREKPLIPGADLEVDIVMEGEERERDPYAEDDESDGEGSGDSDDVVDEQPITAAIELAADARYRATGKRKTAIARVILRPGTGAYLINGRTLDEFFPRPTLQRTIRQPL